MTEKIRQLASIIKQSGREVLIEVDGGINLENAREVIDAGADVLVAGSAVFGIDTEKKIMEFLMQLSKKNEKKDFSKIASLYGCISSPFCAVLLFFNLYEKF